MRIDQPFKVGDWTVEPDRGCIVRDDERRALRPQVMSLLVYLASQDGAMVKSGDILRDLWANRVVTDATLYNCIAELRRLLDEGVGEHRYIETVHKKGYRLCVPVKLIPNQRTSQLQYASCNSEAETALQLGAQRLNRRNLEGWKQAERYFRRAVDLDSANPVAWQKLAASIVAQFGTFEKTVDQLSEALQAAERAIELDGGNGLAWICKARAEAAIAKVKGYDITLELLLPMYERAAELLPDSDEAAREFGNFLIRWPGKADLAIEHLEQSVRLDPLNAENHFALGQAYRLASRSSDALKCLHRARELQPDNPYPIWDIGLTYYHTGSLAEAMRWGERACEFERDDPSGPFLLAHVAMNLGRSELAETWIERGMAQAPETPIAVATRMAFAFAMGRSSEGVEFATRLIPDSGEMQHVHPAAVAQALWVLRDRDINRGQADVALARYQKVVPDLFDENIATRRFWVVAAVDLAYLLRVLDEDQRADRLLEIVRDRAAEMQFKEREIGSEWLQVEAMFMLGDHHGAESMLRDLVEPGWIRWWHYTQSRPTISELRKSDAYTVATDYVKDCREQECARYDAMSGDTGGNPAGNS